MSTGIATAADIKFYEFTATIETTFVVAARDWGEAQRVAEEFASEAIDNAAPIVDVGLGSEIDSDWGLASYGDEIPYSDPALNPRDLTIKELIAAATEGPKPNEMVGPVVWCHGCGRERVQFDWRQEVQLCKPCREPPVLP